MFDERGGVGTKQVTRQGPLALALAMAFSPHSGAQEKPLEQVIASSKRAGEKSILRDVVVMSASISTRDIEKNGATTLAEALDKRAGIALQTECSIWLVFITRHLPRDVIKASLRTLVVEGALSLG
jgi:outer membrane receptor for ferrienterochelin and colicins